MRTLATGRPTGGPATARLEFGPVASAVSSQVATTVASAVP